MIHFHIYTKMETWKTIPEFPHYEVSNLGNVRHKVKQLVRKTQIKNTHKTPYRVVCIRLNGKIHVVKVSNLVLSAFVGPRPLSRIEFITSSHKNGNSLDDRLENLIWEPMSANMKRAKKFKPTRRSTHLGKQVLIDGKEYVSIHDFARLVNKSYMTIYTLAKYGSRDGKITLKNILWNNRRLILLSEKEKIDQIPSVGHPRKEVENGV